MTNFIYFHFYFIVAIVGLIKVISTSATGHSRIQNPYNLSIITFHSVLLQLFANALITVKLINCNRNLDYST